MNWPEIITSAIGNAGFTILGLAVFGRGLIMKAVDESLQRGRFKFEKSHELQTAKLIEIMDKATALKDLVNDARSKRILKFMLPPDQREAARQSARDAKQAVALAMNQWVNLTLDSRAYFPVDTYHAIDSTIMMFGNAFVAITRMEYDEENKKIIYTEDGYGENSFNEMYKAIKSLQDEFKRLQEIK